MQHVEIHFYLTIPLLYQNQRQEITLKHDAFKKFRFVPISFLAIHDFKENFDVFFFFFRKKSQILTPVVDALVNFISILPLLTSNTPQMNVAY